MRTNGALAKRRALWKQKLSNRYSIESRITKEQQSKKDAELYLKEFKKAYPIRYHWIMLRERLKEWAAKKVSRKYAILREIELKRRKAEWNRKYK